MLLKIFGLTHYTIKDVIFRYLRFVCFRELTLTASSFITRRGAYIQHRRVCGTSGGGRQQGGGRHGGQRRCVGGTLGLSEHGPFFGGDFRGGNVSRDRIDPLVFPLYEGFVCGS